jgi:hypothetical protein
MALATWLAQVSLENCSLSRFFFDPSKDCVDLLSETLKILQEPSKALKELSGFLYAVGVQASAGWF